MYVHAVFAIPITCAVACLSLEEADEQRFFPDPCWRPLLGTGACHAETRQPPSAHYKSLSNPLTHTTTTTTIRFGAINVRGKEEPPTLFYRVGRPTMSKDNLGKYVEYYVR